MTCADDKSPKESWIIPLATYLCITLVSACQAGWTRLIDVDVTGAEYAVRGHYMDWLPLRFRRFVGQAA